MAFLFVLFAPLIVGIIVAFISLYPKGPPNYGGINVSRAEYVEPPNEYAHCGNCHGSPLFQPCENCHGSGFVYINPNAKTIPLEVWLKSDKKFDDLWKELNK